MDKQSRWPSDLEARKLHYEYPRDLTLQPQEFSVSPSSASLSLSLLCINIHHLRQWLHHHHQWYWIFHCPNTRGQNQCASIFTKDEPLNLSCGKKDDGYGTPPDTPTSPGLNKNFKKHLLRRWQDGKQLFWEIVCLSACLFVSWLLHVCNQAIINDGEVILQSALLYFQLRKFKNY